jgi:hypothetical protein
MTDPFFTNIEAWNKWMCAWVWPLSIFTFFLGRYLGSRSRRNKDRDETIAEAVNRAYARGYGACIREMGTRTQLPRDIRIVGGRDTEERCS